MSLSNAAETAVLEQIFKGIALPWNANTNLWIALYTANPDETGSATTNEATYGGYARIPVDRTTDLSVTGNTITNLNLEQFAVCTSGTNTITHSALVTTASGAGTIIVYAPLGDAIGVSTGIQPQFGPSSISYSIN